MEITQRIDMMFDQHLEEGRFKNIAMAGLMGASALTGGTQARADVATDKPAVSQQTEKPDFGTDAGWLKYEIEANSYTYKIWTKTHSMGNQWGNKIVTITNVGSHVGQADYNSLKIGMVVTRHVYCPWAKAYGNNGPSNNYEVIHRISRKDKHGHFITRGDNNDADDPGWITPENIMGVCTGVQGVNNDDPSFKIMLPKFVQDVSDREPVSGLLVKEAIDTLFCE